MIQPGTLLQNRYRVAEQIGSGGMGEVYRATDERFQSAVAIKRTFYDDAEMLRAFGREARLLNRLRHSALPKVSDHFDEGAGQFLVMEFIEGSDLSQLLKRRKVPFSLADVLRWADQLLDALEYLHAQEPPVIHRDIKPPNIKLTPQGRVVLLDFGLAKGTTAQTVSGPASSVFGYSLSYAPLEQMQGTGTDARSDLYSLAATLYFLLTGVRPPDALTRAAATIKQQPDPLRPANLVQPQVPAAVGKILQRAMSQNSALRHASATELRAELRRAATSAATSESLPQACAANAPRQSATPHAATSVESRGRLSASPLQASPLSEHDPQASHGSSKPSRASQPSSLPVRETGHAADSRMMDSRGSGLYDSRTVTARARTSSEGSKTGGRLGLVACIVVVCVAVGFYLLTHASGSRATETDVNRGMQNDASMRSEVATPGAKTAAVPSGSTSDAPASNASSQSSRPAFESQASGPQTTAEASGTQTGANTKSGVASSDGVKPPDGADGSATARSDGRHALVIQNPAPSSYPADEARRAEEQRPEQQQPQQQQPPPSYRPPYPNQPPPGFGYPPPPPPGGRMPPPDGRRPPR